MIPYGRQDISAADIEAVVSVLKSDFLTQGPCVPAFEKAVADYCGARYAIAVNSATSALHLACLALGISPGDWVWTTPITFVATANCALYCGANIDFVDIDPITYNISIDCLAEKLALAEMSDRLPKLVIVVHLCGQSCDMAAIHALSQRYGFKIIEDAAHAIGGKYQGQPIGNCRYSDLTVFSFHPVKIITTGEGGMAVCNNKKLAKRMERLRSHGITRDETEMTQASEGPWYYQQLELGFNYRMTDMQAALGMSQLRRLDEFVEKRQQIAKRYDELLAEINVTLPRQHLDSYSGFHLYVIRLKLAQTNKSRLKIFKELHSAKILVNIHYIPLYRQPLYQKFGFKNKCFPRAEEYYAEAISLPIFPNLQELQQEYIVSTLKNIITK